ncbi:MAG: Ig-like domain-containing protein, partial [Isosphaeraceae bacterium]
AGPDGALWFTGIPGEIGRITTAGVVTEFAVSATPTAIAAGPDGALWFTGVPGEVGRISTTGVVTEFAVPEIPPPAGSSPGTAGTLATLTSIAVGPDGALWFTGVPGEVGRITTAGIVTEFAVPAIPGSPAIAGSSAGTPSTPATLNSITAGSDGALWFTGVPGEVGRITTAGVVTEFATPNFTPPSNGIVTTITMGPDGNLWLTGNTAIGRITPTGTFTSFNVPGNFNTIAGLTPGPGGNLWFTEQEDGHTAGEQPAVGEITPAGVTKLYALPQETTLNPNLGVPTDPSVITAGPDGALWFGENGAIGRVTTAGTIQQFPLPTPAATVEDITPGPGGAIWFVQQVTDTCSIGRITTTGTITMYSLSPNSTYAHITEGRDGNLWFTENLIDPVTGNTTVAIGQITPAGQIQTFVLLKKVENNESVGNITVGPDGNLWFPISYGGNSGLDIPTEGAIGRITAKGNVKMYHVFSTSIKLDGSYPTAPPGPSDIISGPDGKLWYQGTVHGTTGIARISTSGKLGPVIPDDNINSNMVPLPNGQVWFEPVNILPANELGVATRSGIVATQDLPESSPNLNPGYSMTIGPDGNLWATSGTSSIVRISGLDSVSGGLDYRHRPKRAPDYSYEWTNVIGSAKPTFAGVAQPGAEVTLWAQKQGDNQPVSIGQVKASNSDGSWTLTSHLKLSDGNYAVTATQTGDTGPPSVLYSLEPDSSGNLSNALVIQTRHGGK